MKITVNYRGYSEDSAIEAIGGVPGGEVKVNDSNAPTVAAPILQDIKKGNTEPVSAKNKNTLEEYVAPKDKDGNYETREEYKYDSTSTESKLNQKNAENSIVATDEEGNELKARDAEEDGGEGANATVAGIGAVAGFIGALTVALGAEATAKNAKVLAKIGVVGPGLAGALLAVVGGGLLLLAKGFDKTDLAKRNTYRGSSSSFIDNAVNAQIAIMDWCNTTKEERTAAMEEQADQAGDATEDLIAQLEELDAQYKSDCNQGGLSDDDFKEIKKAYLAERAALLGEDSPVNAVFEGMGEVMNQGYDELYTMFGEAEGFANGYEKIADFLKIGDSAGKIARTIAILDTVAAAMMTVTAVSMWSNVGFSNPFTFGATLASTNIGILLAATGAGLAIASSIEMYKKMDQEFRCSDSGSKLQNLGVNVLRQTVKDYQGIDGELMGELADFYDGANSESEDAIEDAESKDSTATTKKGGETHLTGEKIDISTGRNVGETDDKPEEEENENTPQNA